MTPKEKALELITKYTEYSYTNVFSFREESNWNYAIKCALLCVEEIVKSLEEYGDRTMELQNMEREFAWWDKVTQEIKDFKK